MDEEMRIVSVGRDPAVNVVDIHYQVRRGAAWADLRHHEPTQDATQGFHDAMDALVPHIAGPYMVPEAHFGRVRVLGFSATYRAPKDDGGPTPRTVKLTGILPAEGFESALPLKIPAQEPRADLAEALEALEGHVVAHIEGTTGQTTLALEGAGF